MRYDESFHAQQIEIDFDTPSEEELEQAQIEADIFADFCAARLARLPQPSDIGYTGEQMGVPGSRRHTAISNDAKANA